MVLGLGLGFGFGLGGEIAPLERVEKAQRPLLRLYVLHRLPPRIAARDAARLQDEAR